MAKVVLSSLKSKRFTIEDIASTVERAIDKLDLDFWDKVKNVVIKPNLCYYWDYSTGQTTDPRVVSAVIDYIRGKSGNSIDISVAEADATAMKTRYSFKILGYDRLCQEKNVRLENLSEGNVVDLDVTVAEQRITLPISETLLKADLIVNVPKLKTQNFVGFSCALKNMFGAISKPRKYSYHGRISETIVGVNKLIKSGIVLVDGLIVHGGYPKKLGVVLAGNDALATDFTGARIARFNPQRIPYLKLAAKERIGEIKKITLVEESAKLADIRRSFPSYSHVGRTISWNLQLKLLRSYAAVVGDVVPPLLER